MSDLKVTLLENQTHESEPVKQPSQKILKYSSFILS